ncbi:Y-family DNA polymerase [Mucilaginibacter ginsenosidivorax]|uniref:Y-family DNA polymerase n=1 Tax=Mucilaginibacter ginsenosidivorax TaxID=862126 RepID=A0A5B8W4I2_9SPHI|nr:Y-family DNA polymerase [Mucilaginibacter ginsenosidivorax]QEC77816.1 Y-family DNA polymerase [Mucilaginibacter ginsenosidivorax]
MVGIIDCNNFYASCERAFNPALKDVPVIIYSNNDGAVIARSEEAKALGIGMAVPMYEIKRLMKIHNIQGFSSNYTLYGDMSKRIKAIIRQFFHEVEDYSIDESFVSCKGLKYRDQFSYIKDARDKISRWSGVPVSIGVAETKTLAKLANRIAKKQFRETGVYILDTEDKRIDALKNTEITDLWGVARRLGAKLNAKGIATAYDLSMVAPEWAKTNFSVVLQRTIYELNGVQCIPLELVQPDKQNIASQKSFGKFQTEFEPMAEALANYTARVAEKLRRQNFVAGGIRVWLGTNNFSKTDAQYFPEISTVCDVPTDYTPSLIKSAIEALHVIYKKGYLYKRVGIMLIDLRHNSDGTQNLFRADTRQREIAIIKRVDRLNHLNGRDTVRSAQQGFQADWRMKQDNLSPKYTTRLTDIIHIK